MNTNYVITFSDHATAVHSGWPKGVILAVLGLFIAVLVEIGKRGKNSN